MPDIVLTSLHKGMDLKSQALDVKPGYTVESVGCDFHVPGKITPMRSDELIQTFEVGVPDVQWASILYIQGVQYQFTTHSDGLRVSSGGSVSLIDSAFTGRFCCLAINDQYVVFSSSTLTKKWAPGWTATDQWGVNTPSQMTLSLGALKTKAIESFQSTSGWTAGTGATVTLDSTTPPPTGTASVNLAGAAKKSVYMTKTESLDLSMFTTPGDLGTGFMEFWVFASDLAAVTSVHLMFDCSAAANFTSDWYQFDININNVASATVNYTAGGTVAVPSGNTSIAVTPSGQIPTWVYDASQDQIDVVGIPTSKTKKQEVIKYQTYKISDQPIAFKQVLTLTKKKRQVQTTSGVWMQFKVQISEFARNGANPAYDWGTISAIRIKLDIGSLANGESAGSINVSNLNLLGGGLPFGAYYFAVAYEDVFGNYGPYSDFAGPIEADGVPIVISNIPVDTDTHTSQRRIAVIGGSMTDPMVFWISDNTTTSYIYNSDDSAFSTIETNFNEDPPNPCTDMVLTGGRIFMVSGNGLYYSDIGFYEGFPASNVIMFPSETLNQVAVLQNQYIAARGITENLVQILSSDPTQWPVMPGAEFGAQTPYLNIDLANGQQSWASQGRFWQTSDSEYLPEIGYAVSDFSQIFGAQAGLLTYLYFVDSGGTGRILRIDYRIGFPIAHYVENITPTCIFADGVKELAYYSIGNKIYQFDAGTGPLPTFLTIPEQYDGNTKIKDWFAVNYDLSGGPLGMTLFTERAPYGGEFGQGTPGQGVFGQGGYTLPNASLDGDAITLPFKQSPSLGMVLTSTSDQDFILTMPFKIKYE